MLIEPPRRQGRQEFLWNRQGAKTPRKSVSSKRQTLFETAERQFASSFVFCNKQVFLGVLAPWRFKHLFWRLGGSNSLLGTLGALAVQ
ncbi:MAG: hypothetical protein HY941_06850 [Gammaproteobacteria bacterium]|nr:hypothetical protein [Gammaproteobacteria bacterium]